MAKTYTPKQTQQEKLKEITDNIEQGIKDVFSSEKYTQYLQTMSQFHNYSLNNTILIAMQNPDATRVAGFNKWKDNFERHVKKGEKGLKIIVPSPYKTKTQVNKLDPKTKKPILDKNGSPQTETIERETVAFKLATVFDVSQTEGKELPSITTTLTSDVQQYEDFFKALEKVSPVPISFEKIGKNGVKGYFNLTEQRIVLGEGASELQSIKTLIHEIAHSKLHNVDKDILPSQYELTSSRSTQEVEAESIAYTICQYYGLDTSDYSFGYIAGWSSDKELTDLKSSLTTINKTSSELITGIDKQLAILAKEREALTINEPISQAHYNKPLVGKIKYLDMNGEVAYDKKFTDRADFEKTVASSADCGEPIDITVFSATKEDRAFVYKLDPPLLFCTFAEFGTEFELDDNIKELALKLKDKYFAIHETDTGFDYTFYNRHFDPLDGGVYDDPTSNIHEAIKEILDEESLNSAKVTDYDLLTEVEDLRDEREPQINNEKVIFDENNFLNNTNDSFAIYQLKDKFINDLMFKNFEKLNQEGLSISSDNYKLVYTNSIDLSKNNINQTLEDLFVEFNFKHPADFTGHSLSVSDIVAIKQDNVVSSYYVDSIGFKAINDFIKSPTVGIRTLAPSRFKDTTAFIGTDNKLYLGNKNQLDEFGNYNNSDNSLVLVSNSDMPLNFLTSFHTILTQNEALQKGHYTMADYVELDRIQKEVLPKFEQAIEFTFGDGKTFELSTEQNYNMIDGIVNNEPPKPPKKKKESVIAQLKNKPHKPHKPQRTRKTKTKENEREI